MTYGSGLLGKRNARVCAAGTIILALAVGSFIIGRSISNDSGALGGPPLTSGQSPTSTVEELPTPDPAATPEPTPSGTPPPPDERDLAWQEELSKPRFSGTFNGIEIGTQVTIEFPPGVCTSGNIIGGAEYPDDVAFDAAADSPLHFTARYLPSGAQLSGSFAVLCDNVIVVTDKTWDLWTEGVGVASVEVSRELVTGHPFPFDTSADRLEQLTIAGRPAVGIHPLSQDGYGPSGIAIVEEFGTTILLAYNVTFADLLRTAEGLY